MYKVSVVNAGFQDSATFLPDNDQKRLRKKQYKGWNLVIGIGSHICQVRRMNEVIGMIDT